MKRRILTIAAGLATTMVIIAATVQTLNVRLGEVIYQYATDQVGRMNLSNNGTIATILNKVFNLGEVDEMYIDESPVTDNMVYVDYDGTSAEVRVAGNIAQYIDVIANGAHVAIIQSSDFAGDDLGEITYVLSGTSTNGSRAKPWAFRYSASAGPERSSRSPAKQRSDTVIICTLYSIALVPLPVFSSLCVES